MKAIYCMWLLTSGRGPIIVAGGNVLLFPDRDVSCNIFTKYNEIDSGYQERHNCGNKPYRNE